MDWFEMLFVVVDWSEMLAVALDEAIVVADVD